MWADTLLDAERAFLLRFLIWGGASATLGLGLLGVGARRSRRAPMLDGFAIQTAVWGAVAFVLATAAWWRADLRDYASAARLVRMVQLMIALDAGMIGAGVALWVRGRRGKSPGRVGAGVGLLTQGAGWVVLHVGFASFLRNAV